MTPGSDLAQFLMARIAEDEVVARGARPHEYLNVRDSIRLNSANRGGYTCVGASSGRVLAECNAKLRIVAYYEGSLKARSRTKDPVRDALAEAINESHLDALKAIALPYADHADYRPEWKP